LGSIVTEISRKDKLIYSAYSFLHRRKEWIITLCSGFLLGRIVNELSIADVTFNSFLGNVFSVSVRSTNCFSWIAVILILSVPTVIIFLSKLHESRRYDLVFAELIKRHKSPAIAQYTMIGWGDAQSMQECPELHRGWKLGSIRLEYDTTRFVLSSRYTSAYKQYYDENKEEERFCDDGTKYMVVINPTSFTDTPSLKIQIQETVYSQVRFYQANVATLASERQNLIKNAMEGTIEFPHSLCMHLVVVTKDDSVLLTKRSNKVAYHPGTWSYSVEEQLAPDDLKGDIRKAVSRWGERFLFEELGLRTEYYDEENFRILSVFIETDSLNR